MCYFLLGLVVPEFDKVPGNLYLLNFSVEISASEDLGPGTNGSAVCVSVCLIAYSLY
jgi:predicted component of type VI protein secretion system